MTEILDALKAFHPAANIISPKRSILPILAHIAASGNKLIATDLEHRLEMQFDYAGDFTMPIRMLKDLIKNKHESIVITGNQLEQSLLLDGVQTVKYKCKPMSEYPNGEVMHKGRFTNLGAWDREMVEYLSTVLPMISKNELKPSLMGVYFKQEDRSATLCGTDGHRLMLVKDVPANSLKQQNFIIPSKAIKVLKKFMDDEVQVATTDTHIRFTLPNNMVLYSRLIQERYPDYEGVFPRHPKDAAEAALAKDDSYNSLIRGSYEVNRAELLKMVVTATAFANHTTHQMTIDIPAKSTKATLSSQDIETEMDWRAELNLISHKGPGITIGYDAKKLESLLKATKAENVTFEYVRDVSASIIRGDDERVTMVLMPIRLND